FTATGTALVGRPPAIDQSSKRSRTGIISAPARPAGIFGKDVIAPAIALH
ncbi:4793_t:CDS:1, partial [Funneliformis geosporum]